MFHGCLSEIILRIFLFAMTHLDASSWLAPPELSSTMPRRVLQYSMIDSSNPRSAAAGSENRLHGTTEGLHVITRAAASA
eukprot:7009813-Prymnesium_polylepis.1